MKNNNFDSIAINDAINKLDQFLNSNVPSGTTYIGVLVNAQRANTALQILTGRLIVTDAKVTLESTDNMPEQFGK
jgi:hypothetical protein